MDTPHGYTTIYLPNVTGPVMVWACGDCAALIEPMPSSAMTHDRFHDRIAVKTGGRRR
jgi:hypothetical protein